MSHEHTYSRALYTFFLLKFFDIIVLDFELPVALYFWCLIFWTLVSDVVPTHPMTSGLCDNACKEGLTAVTKCCLIAPQQAVRTTIIVGSRRSNSNS